MITAEEFWKTTSPDEKYGMLAELKKLGLDKHVYEVMRRFAKLHVEAALKEASENAESIVIGGLTSEVNKDSILNAYSLTNIK